MIGIGAGADTDGQVLVLHDMLGIYPGQTKRHAKRYADLHSQMLAAVSEYAEDVRLGRFPSSENTFSIDPEELEKLVNALRSPRFEDD